MDGGAQVLVLPDRYCRAAELLLPVNDRLVGWSFPVVKRPTAAPDAATRHRWQTAWQVQIERLAPNEYRADGDGLRLFCPSLPRMPLTVALQRRWATDVHFAAYGVPGVTAMPRLRLSSAITELDVRLAVWFIDLDRPGHAPWRPLEAAVAFHEMRRRLNRAGRFGRGCGFYLTRAGVRLVRPLQPAVTLSSGTAAETLQWSLRAAMRRLAEEGVAAVSVADNGPGGDLELDLSCMDWTRLMRAPYAKRDGRVIDLPMELAHMRPLDVDWLPVPEPMPSPPASTPDGERPAAPAGARIGPSAAPRLVNGDRFAPAVQGMRGDAHTFRLACHLVHELGLSDSDALAVMLDWNGSCIPPWEPAELEAKISNARRYGNRRPSGHSSPGTGLFR